MLLLKYQIKWQQFLSCGFKVLYSVFLFIFLTVWRKGFLGLGILFTVFFAYVAYATLSDPYIGVGIIKEQGRPYIIASYSAAVINALCSALGLIKNKAKFKSGT